MNAPFRSIRIVTFLLLLSGFAAVTSAQSNDDLRTQIEALKARVSAQDVQIARLQGHESERWLTEQRAAEIRALVQDVLADADSRANLLQDGATAGHDGKNFFLQNGDGSFRMNISGILQFRYIANFRDEALDDDNEAGFQFRRVKVKFEGHIGAPEVLYAIQVASNRDTGEAEVDMATVGYRFSDTYRIDAGRFKDPFLREEFTAASRQLAIERSLLNAIFTANYVEGIRFEKDATDWLRLTGSINDGVRSGDPGGPGNDFANDATDFAGTVRADARLAGEWAQFSDFAAWSGEPMGIFLGAAAHYEVAETGDMQVASPGVDSFITYVVDGSLETGGFNLYGAYIGRHVDRVEMLDPGSFSDMGALVQAGYMIVPDKFEPFARFEWISPDDDRGFDDMSLVTLGANYYFKKHAAKLTADFILALDELNAFAFSSPTSRTGLGLLPDVPGQSDQVVARIQFQLLF